MESASIKICRGKDWGERLRQELGASGLGEMQWLEQHTQLLKKDAHSRVGLLQFSDRLCYLKYYRAKSAGQKMLFRLGYARALHSFDAATQLLRAGVKVPQPLSCLLLPRGMMLLTQGIDQSKDLKELWRDNIESSQQELLLARAGATLARLHRAGYCHGDCKWSNWLWSGEDFYLVDLEGVKQTPVDGNSQLRDLARFTVNAEDLGVAAETFEQFLDSYLDGGRRSRESVGSCGSDTK
jgi:tRNA A-37 threonylcarbamoyl transferase component Bud32